MPHSDVIGNRCATVADLAESELRALVARYSLSLEMVEDDAPIPGSYWGEPEAGISGRTVHVRADTPIHSLLHETSHIVCMSAARRDTLHRDAGGSDLEEAAVCYLQLLLADQLARPGRRVLMRDMDRWGYSFRLGSTARWFTEDAKDACEFLRRHGITDASGAVTWRMRGENAS